MVTKRVIMIFLTVIMVFGVVILSPFTFTIQAASAETIDYTVTGGSLRFDITTGTIIDYTGYSTDLVIPNTINGVSVTGIGDFAFFNCDTLSCISIPEGVIKIGDFAFEECSSLTNISVPDSVTSIGESAFANCRSLTGISIPASVTSISDSTFFWCDSLTNIIIPNSITCIGDRAFYCCKSLTDVVIPDNVTSIGYRAFDGCSSLTGISIPAGVLSIGESAFTRTNKLTAITVETDNPVYTSKDGVLFNKTMTDLLQCPGTKSGCYTIPASVTSISNEAFCGCINLTALTVENDNPVYTSKDGVLFNKTLTELAHCPSGKSGSYIIPNGVTSIGDYAFISCINLSNISIPASVTNIGDSAFLGCLILSNIHLPDGVTSIGDYAFCCCNLSSISIPASVTSIGNGAFEGCPILSSIHLPDSITRISDRAFYNCSKLSSISIPASVTNIGDSAFSRCRNLSSISIPEGVISIGDRAFEYCSSLTSISIPASVTCIGNGAFQSCSNLSIAYFYGNAPSMGRNVFNLTKEDLTVYYLAGKTGFTNPWLWSGWWDKGYPTAIFDPTLPRTNISGNNQEATTNMANHQSSNWGCIGTPVAEPIDSATGAHSLQRSLLTLHGAQELTFTVGYYSLLNNQGPLGRGWNHNFETSLEVESSNRIILHWNANQCNHFTLGNSGDYSSDELSVKYDQLIKNSDGSFTLTRKDQSVYQFNSDGYLTQQIDRNGRARLLFYSSDGKLQTVSEPISGQVFHFSYNADDLINRVIDRLGREVSFSYDEDHNLTAICDANGKTTTYTYSSEGYVLSATDSSGNILFTDTYDSAGRIIKQQDAIPIHSEGTFNYDEISQPGKIVTTYTNRNGKSSILVHDSNYHLISQTDENGNTVKYTYDTNGNRTRITDANGNTTTYTYDDQGNLLSTTDPAGHTTTMTYDDRNNLLTINRLDGKITTMTYDDKNNLLTTTDAAGYTTTYTYDDNSLMLSKNVPDRGISYYTYENGLLKTATDPSGVTISFTYDEAGRIISITDETGNSTTISYDALDNILSTTDPLGHSKYFTYDSHSNKLTETDFNGNPTFYTYNGNDKLTSKKDALGYITTFEYDGEDRIIKTTDPLGHSIAYTYDAAGHLTGLTDALGNTVTTQYDPNGNITGIVDAKGNTLITNNYNNLNQLVSISDALGNTTMQEYDVLGNLDKFTDPKSRVSSLNYDPMNRLISVVDPMSGTSSQTFDAEGRRLSLIDPNNNQQTFVYDQAGRLISQKDAAGNTLTIEYDNLGLRKSFINARGQQSSYQYDQAGRLSSLITPEGTQTYTYDNKGNRLTVTNSSGTISRTYDPLNRLTSYTDAKGNGIGYQYDAVGNLIKLSYPDGKEVNYQYDAANRLIRVTDWASRVTSYQYDANNRLTRTDRPDGSVLTFTYNAAGQLLQQKDVDKSGGLICQYDFTYDEVGNVVTEQSSLTDPNITTKISKMTYGYSNRLISYNGQQVTYDADGNMLQGPLNEEMRAFTYDSQNRLTKAGNTSYTYDAENNRIGVIDSDYHTDYVINPNAALSQVLVSSDNVGNKTFYVYGLGLIGQESDGTYSAYHYDRRGSTAVLTSMEGTITDNYSYGPFGELINHTGSTTTPFLYNGRDGVMTDTNGLYYMRARYYNPEIKRFINQDVLLGTINEGQSLNRYAYVQGRPIMAIDPSGNDLVDGFLAFCDKLPGSSGPCGSLSPEKKLESNRQTRQLLNNLYYEAQDTIKVGNRINREAIKDLPSVAWEIPGQVSDDLFNQSRDPLEFTLKAASPLPTLLKAGVKSSFIVDAKQGEMSEDMKDNLCDLTDLISNGYSINKGLKELTAVDISKFRKVKTALGMGYDFLDTNEILNKHVSGTGSRVSGTFTGPGK